MEDDPHDSTDNSSNENEDYVNKLRENIDKNKENKYKDNSPAALKNDESVINKAE